MKNPREDIELDTYEKHMSLDSVFQYQILNKIICLQLNDYDVNCVCILGIGGFLLALIGFGLIFSWSQLVGTIMIWIFALWALIRGVMLIIFGINNKDQQPLRWGIVGLGCLLFILAIVIICVPKSESRIWAGVCIGISTVIDGISLLVAALKLKNTSSLQDQIINQAEQNEIGQGNVVVTETVVISQN